MMTTTNPRQSIIRLAISNTDVLRACYMPFLQRKGLFVPSANSREPGEKLFLIVRLVQQNLTAAGITSVCWITPKYCSDGREPGFGLHFDDSNSELASVIESALAADNSDSVSVSYTL